MGEAPGEAAGKKGDGREGRRARPRATDPLLPYYQCITPKRICQPQKIYFFLAFQVDKCLTIPYNGISGENPTNTMKENKMTNEEFLAKVAEIMAEALADCDEE